MAQYDPEFLSDRQYAALLDSLLHFEQDVAATIARAYELGLLSHPDIAWEDDEYEYVFDKAA